MIHDKISIFLLLLLKITISKPFELREGLGDPRERLCDAREHLCDPRERLCDPSEGLGDLREVV
jgi:hypothetical protein